MSARKAAQARTASVFWLASLVFFLSGGTGLVYQVVWFKRFAHVWGSSSLAFAAVGASFLFGLGVGAYLFGRRADALLVPLRWYGLCELAIGVLALAIPYEIAALVDASVGLYARIPEQPLARYVVQFVITLVVVGPPCVLMGGTLPLLIRQLTARDGSLDEATGWLYAINTFGAAAGCYLAGFHLLPALGLLWTNNAAAILNLSIGGVSLAIASALERTAIPRAAAKGSPPRAPWTWQRGGLYLATALSGCAALVLEMTWTRQLSLVLGGSTYALTATLFVVLVGIALGSLIFHAYLRPVASSPWLPIGVVGLIVVATLAGVLLLPPLSTALGPAPVREWRASSLGNGLVCVVVSTLVEFLPAVGMGILFPLFVHLTGESAAKVGSAVGKIYACNTTGSIVGASLTAILLFPSIGTAGAAALATAMYVVSLAAILPWRPLRQFIPAALATAAGAVVVALVARPADPRLTNLGRYTGQNSDLSIDQVQTLFFEEGASSNVFVTLTFPHQVSLRVNGKVDASNGADMCTQTGAAYFPHLLNPGAREVLIIGFGSGCTSGRSLLFPETRVTCCELEPAVYAASPYFAAVNGRPQDLTRAALVARNADLPPGERLTPADIERQARFTIVFGDGRTALQASDKKYDIISSEPSNPWIAGVSNLFTREFFRTAREHLNEGGVLAQWIQTYNFTLDDYLMIVRTMRTEFPYYGVVELAGGADTLLVASTRPLVPDARALARLQPLVDANPTMRADFDAWFGSRDLRWALLLNYVLGKDDLDRLVDRQPRGPINTDLDLRLEFDAPLHLFRDLEPAQRAGTALASAGRGNWTVALAEKLGVTADAAMYLQLGDGALRQALAMAGATLGSRPDMLRIAAGWYQKVLQIDPQHALARRNLERVKLRLDPKLLAVRTGTAVEAEELVPIYRRLIELDPADAAAHADLAFIRLSQGQRREAIDHFREALRLEPALSLDTRTYLWANNLAWLLATSPESELRNGDEAVRWAQQACAIAQDTAPEVIDTLAAALAEAGRFDEAIQASKRILELAPYRKQLVEDVKQRIKLYQASQPYREG